MTATHIMGPIRCRNEASAASAAAAIEEPLPDAEVTVSRRAIKVTWDGDDDVGEVVAMVARPWL